MDCRNYKLSAKEDLRQTASPYKRITLVLLLSLMAIFGVQLFLAELTESGSTSGHYLSTAISSSTRNYMLLFAVELLCQFLLTPLLRTGYIRFALRLCRGEECDLKVLAEGGRFWTRVVFLYLQILMRICLWSILFSWILSNIYVMAMGSAILSGEELSLSLYHVVGLVGITLLLVFFVSYRYRMAWFVLNDNPSLSASQCLRATTMLNRGHRMELFLMDLSFLPWFLLSILTCGILLIWKLPYIVTAYAHAYDSWANAPMSSVSTPLPRKTD